MNCFLKIVLKIKIPEEKLELAKISIGKSNLYKPKDHKLASKFCLLVSLCKTDNSNPTYLLSTQSITKHCSI